MSISPAISTAAANVRESNDLPALKRALRTHAVEFLIRDIRENAEEYDADTVTDLADFEELEAGRVTLAFSQYGSGPAYRLLGLGLTQPVEWAAVAVEDNGFQVSVTYDFVADTITVE